jgi:hypothetical protein
MEIVETVAQEQRKEQTRFPGDERQQRVHCVTADETELLRTVFSIESETRLYKGLNAFAMISSGLVYSNY